MENKSHRPVHIIILYVLAIAAIAFATFIFWKDTQSNSATDGAWQCDTVVCAKNVDPQEWVAKNCGLVPGPNSTQTLECRFSIDNQSVSVPLQQINLSVVSQFCQAYTCVREARIRPVNYTYTAPGTNVTAG